MKSLELRPGLLLALAVLPVLYFGSLRVWTWGTADEPGLVMDARRLSRMPNGQGMKELFSDVRPTAGRFHPLWQPWGTGRLMLWESATGQHAVQVALIGIVLWIWALMARAYGLEWDTIFLGLFFTLYWGPFTVGSINFLSVQELPGLLLMSAAVWSARCSPRSASPVPLIASFAFAVLAILLKETFFSLALLIPIALWHAGMKGKEKAAAVFWLVFFLVYPVFLLRYVKGSYSAGYDIHSVSLSVKVESSVLHLLWSYKFAAPFLIAGWGLRLRDRDWNALDGLCWAGWALYFVTLVPWTSEMTYYQGPFAPFMGFLTARGAQKLAEGASPRPIANAYRLSAAALCLLCVFSIARQTRRAYRVNRGIQQVEAYLIGHWANEPVYVNGEEAAVRLPEGMTIASGRSFPKFIYARPQDTIAVPSYILISTGQTRYLPPALPATVVKLLETDGWTLYRAS